MYNVPVVENQSSKPVTLHLSQVVNRVSRCNYVLRRFVREAQKFSPKLEEKRPASQPIQSKTFISSQSHDSKDIELFHFEQTHVLSLQKVDVVYSSILLNKNFQILSLILNHRLHHGKQVV